MARRDEFDDEGFFESLLNRKGKTDLPPGLRRIFIVIAVLVVVSILIAIVAASWPSGHDTPNGSAVPIIRADNTPFKVKPEDPGGMAVPNKDSTIFETLKGQREENKVENLLEESGDDTAASIARENVASKVEKKTEPLVDVKLEKTGDAPIDELEDAPPQPEPVKSETAKAPVKEAEVKQDMVEKEEADDTPSSIIETLKQDSKPKKVIPAKAEAKPVSTGGSTYIQLASVKSEEDARKQWSGIKSKNPELSNLSMKVQKADLGEKGIYYRVQAGPLSVADATSTCSAIKSRGGNCLIAK